MAYNRHITAEQLNELTNEFADLMMELMPWVKGRQKVRQRRIQRILADVAFHNLPAIQCEIVTDEMLEDNRDDSGPEQEQPEQDP